MNEPLSDLAVVDAEEVRASDIPRALTAASILYEDGATQAFACLLYTSDAADE